MFAHGVLKIIYAPHKAFKEIMRKPKVFGPIIIMVLFILASVGSEYARASRIYVQMLLPDSLDSTNPDPWTENAAMWQSNANITLANNDRIIGSGSIQFDATNDTTIWCELKSIGTIDCSSGDGYGNLTFSMRWIHPTLSAPQNLSLNVYTMNATSHFSRDLSGFINATGNGQWENLTIPLGPTAEGWLDDGSQPSWGNVTGLGFEATWAESNRSNLTVRVDQVFFQSDRFSLLLDSIGSNYPISVVSAVMTFAVNWMIFGLVLFVASKIFKIKTDLKTLFIIIGYSLMAFVFMQLLFSVMYLSSSPMYFSLDTVTPLSAYNNVVTFSYYITLLVPIWSIVLAALALRAGFSLPLRNCMIMSVIAFLPHYVLLFFA
ncbi:YIP1 family protein [Candidatus Bathyarchaeota archaeon]|nr:YIP1 family protein [Candidatus Bathyarchaeota archaeon]